MFDLIT